MKTSVKEEKGIINYLLGQSTEDERLQIEENYFQRPEYYEQVLAIEEDLIRDYIVNAMPLKQRALFETQFLTSERRRKKYEAAKSLTAYLADAYLPQPLPLRSKSPLLARLLSGARRITFIQAAGAITAMLLFAFMGVLWTARQQMISSGDPIAVLSPATSPDGPAPAAEQPTNHLPAPKAELPRTKSSPSVKAENSTFAFLLPIGSVRGKDEIKELKIPSKAQAIQLDLSLIEWDYSRYNVSVKTIDGKQVLQRENLTPRKTRKGRVLTVSIPSKVLPDAEFVLNISGIGEKGEPKMIEESFFSIKRE